MGPDYKLSAITCKTNHYNSNEDLNISKLNNAIPINKNCKSGKNKCFRVSF